ncbi:hypothetical protein D3C74_30460 [compost metagenome]
MHSANYLTDLKSKLQDHYTVEFAHYQEVLKELEHTIIAESNLEGLYYSELTMWKEKDRIEESP